MLAPGVFLERLQQSAATPSASLALLLLDLRQFHAINHAFGYAAGDRLLEMVGGRLAGKLHAQDLLTRIGGDEFAVLLSDVFDSASAMAAAHELLDGLRAPFVLRDRRQAVAARAGIALCPAHGRDTRALLHVARAALHGAKDNGLEVVVASPGAESSLRRPGGAAAEAAATDMPSGRELCDGLLRGEFTVHYQPIHNVGTGVVDTLEALVRWRHPSRGLLEPASFLPAAARFGLAHVISVRVLDCACDSLRQWRARGHAALRVAVNLSAQDFRRPDFAATLGATLARHKLPPSSLELELTEHEPLDDERAVAQVAELDRQGVSLTLDDFGVKYSSLRHLHRLPVRALKVDRSFVHDVGRSEASNSIVTAIIGIAGKMGLRLVAEGVEEVRQMHELRRLGCHVMQGFLFSPAVPADAVSGYLNRTATAF